MLIFLLQNAHLRNLILGKCGILFCFLRFLLPFFPRCGDQQQMSQLSLQLLVFRFLGHLWHAFFLPINCLRGFLLMLNTVLFLSQWSPRKLFCSAIFFYIKIFQFLKNRKRKFPNSFSALQSAYSPHTHDDAHSRFASACTIRPKRQRPLSLLPTPPPHLFVLNRNPTTRNFLPH